MKDNPQRRNRVAALVIAHYAEAARNAYEKRPDPNKTVAMDLRLVVASYTPALLALNGETDLAKLGIDPLSMTAMQITALTTDPIEEPNLNE